MLKLEKHTPFIVILLISTLLCFSYLRVTFLISAPPKIKQLINWKGTITERHVGIKSGKPVLTQTSSFTSDGQIIDSSQEVFQKWEIVNSDESKIKLIDKNGNNVILKYNGFYYHGYTKRFDRSSPNTLQLEINK